MPSAAVGDVQNTPFPLDIQWEPTREIASGKLSAEAWVNSSTVQRRKYIQKGASALMNPPKESSRGKLTGGKPASSRKLDELNAKIQDMQLEIDILKETIDVLKKTSASVKCP